MSSLRSKTLTQIEESDWGPPRYDSYLVTTCHRLRHKPIGAYTSEDLRIMLGQRIGVPLLLPIALERLDENPLAAGDLYPGDLLVAVLRLMPDAAAAIPDLRPRLRAIVEAARVAAARLEPHDRETLEATVARATAGLDL